MGPFRRLAVDNRLSRVILMIMLKRDNDARPLSKPWQGRFHSFLVDKRLASEEMTRVLRVQHLSLRTQTVVSWMAQEVLRLHSRQGSGRSERG